MADQLRPAARRGRTSPVQRAPGARRSGHSAVAALLADDLATGGPGDDGASGTASSGTVRGSTASSGVSSGSVPSGAAPSGDSSGSVTSGAAPTGTTPGGEPVTRPAGPVDDGTRTPGGRAPGGRARTSVTAQRPPLDDVALGLLTVIVERLWGLGTRGAGLAGTIAGRLVAVARGVSPAYANSWLDAHLDALADRGQQVRAERSETVSGALTAAMTTAVTSEAVHDMTVTAFEQATDELLAVMLPAMLDALDDEETRGQLDELMAGLLLRQLPDALERTLPGVMVRTATRTSLGIVPSLMGALTSGLSGEPGPPGERRAPRP